MSVHSTVGKQHHSRQGAQRELTESGKISHSKRHSPAASDSAVGQAAQKETTEIETGGRVTVSDQLFIARLDATSVNVGLVSASGEPLKPA